MSGPWVDQGRGSPHEQNFGQTRAMRDSGCYSGVVNDRRREPRVTLRSSGLIDLGDHSVPCQTLDLSERGLSLVAPLAAPLRSVRVRFRLAEHAPWTDVDGRVVRCKPLEGPGQAEFWGLELHPMDLGTQTRLRNYIRAACRDEWRE